MYMTWGQIKDYFEKKLKIKDDQEIAMIDIYTTKLPKIKSKGLIYYIGESNFDSFDSVTNEYIGDH